MESIVAASPVKSLPEKVLTLDTGKRLARILQASGDMKVVMTRDNDTLRFVDGKNEYRGTSTRGVTRYSFRFIITPHYGRVRSVLRRTTTPSVRSVWLPWFIQESSKQWIVLIAAFGSVGYRVLRRNRLPAILIECGFLTNHVEGGLSLPIPITVNGSRGPLRVRSYGMTDAGRFTHGQESTMHRGLKNPGLVS